MELRFPLKDVFVKRVGKTRRVEHPLYAETYWQMNQQEFAMQVEGVVDFYACDGSEVEYTPVDGADRNSIELYLNGSVYGAILHQRKILPMHGSSFIYKGLGIMICGEAGAGKSSVTASFCLNGAEFLTDDVTPVLFRDNIPYIWAMSDRIKLWDDTLKQLEQEKEGLQQICPETDKYYYPMPASPVELFKPAQIFILKIGKSDETVCEELSGPAAFQALRNEIYRPEYMRGMPENDPLYFRNIVEICQNVKVIRVERSTGTGITSLKKTIEEILKAELCHER